MTEVAFYHLSRQPLEAVLPRLLQKALEGGWRAVVMAASEDRVEALNTLLWTYDDRGFLPHGSAKDGYVNEQPIYLTTQDENPNEARLLVLTEGMTSAKIANYERCLDLFDGNDSDAVAAARERWRHFKEMGWRLTYWQQTQQGAWEKKADAG